MGNRWWVQEQLDRALVSTNWVGMFCRSKLFHIVSSTFDHSILLLKATNPPQRNYRRAKHFRFEAMWLRDKACSEIVQEAWVRGESMGS